MTAEEVRDVQRREGAARLRDEEHDRVAERYEPEWNWKPSCGMSWPSMPSSLLAESVTILSRGRGGVGRELLTAERDRTR